MIVKSFEIKKIKGKHKFFLFYGENQGFKNQLIDEEFKKKNLESCYFYEENEILNNKETFFSNLLTKSFFENEKLIIINRATDKIKELVEEIVEKNPEGVILIVNGGILEKKSKLRSFFEKNELTVCVPFYEDNAQTLSTITSQFFRENNIQISQQIINLIVGRSRGDRQNLKNELERAGHRLASDTDTEVIAHLITHYLEIGQNILNALESSFQTLWDQLKRQIHLHRSLN